MIPEGLSPRSPPGAGTTIAAKAVVTRGVAPYSGVAGNRAHTVRCSFDDPTRARRLDIASWDWPPDRISRNLNAIRGADRAALETAR